MLLSEMHNRINEEPTDPDNSIDLYRCPMPPQPETEKVYAIVSLDTASTRKPKHTFEIKRSKSEAFITKTVTFIY